MMHYETQPINLLLIENKSALRAVLMQHLHNCDLKLNVVEAQSGELAIELFKQNHYDCVLLSDSLEDLTAQLVLAYFQNGPTLSIPVIVLTEGKEVGLDLEVLESGAVDFIPKDKCTEFLLRRVILYALVRQQYMKSQHNYLMSQKQLAEQQQINEQNKKMSRLKMEKAHAEAANKAKSQFLSNMSHELKTPLNAILGFSQLLLYKAQTPLSELQKNNVLEIVKAGDLLLLLINDVLDLARIEAGKINMNFEPVNVLQVLTESTGLIVNMIKLKDCKISIDCDDSIMVKADYIRFKQVILNLLSNAIKYNKFGGSVKMSCIRCDNMVRIYVVDSGIGIAADRFDDVFKPFNRLSNNRSIEGTGIGLTLSQKIIGELKGAIGFDSQLGQGSQFWIDVPMVPFVGENINTGSISKSLLYIDADDFNASVVKCTLDTIAGLIPMVAQGIQKAIELSVNHPPVIIIIDIDALESSLQTMLSQLREVEVLSHIPIIVLTSEASRELINEGLQLGCEQVLVKPLEGTTLQEIVGYSLVHSSS